MTAATVPAEALEALKHDPAFRLLGCDAFMTERRAVRAAIDDALNPPWLAAEPAIREGFRRDGGHKIVATDPGEPGLKIVARWWLESDRLVREIRVDTREGCATVAMGRPLDYVGAYKLLTALGVARLGGDAHPPAAGRLN